MKLQIATLLIALSLFIVACNAAQTPATQATNPAAVLMAFNNALNAGDVDAAMALVADDAVMDRGPYGVRTGKAAIRDALQIETSKKLKYEVSNIQVSGNK